MKYISINKEEMFFTSTDPANPIDNYLEKNDYDEFDNAI